MYVYISIHIFEVYVYISIHILEVYVYISIHILEVVQVCMYVCISIHILRWPLPPPRCLVCGCVCMSMHQ